jgi:hypothetical protein
VRRCKQETARPQDSSKLVDRLKRVCKILKNLRAEDDVKLLVRKWKGFGPPYNIDAGPRGRVESNVFTNRLGEERLVWAAPAPDVEQARSAARR